MSRIAGLIRERVFAHYFGTSLFADVFRAALRMPNVLQNLLGEGTLSASFIPVYSELLARGEREAAGRVAGAVFALLLMVAGALSLLGVLLAPVLVSIFLPGFDGIRRELSIVTVRIIFPMTGLLVLASWSLGVLNSHRRFFIPYVAPVLWNAAMIVAMMIFGARLAGGDLVIAVAWGALVGGALQFLVQLPWVLKLEPQLRVRLDRKLQGFRTALRNAGPAILGRGVVQLSGWVDLVLASLLSFGAVAALGYAQTLYVLPVSLFGMSVAAAELPELARSRTGDPEALRRRVLAGFRRIAFLVVPSVIGYLTLGDIVVAALYETGDFGRDDTVLVAVVLAGYTLGLFASTATRLYSSAFFALHDTATPAKVALVRVVGAAGVGYLLMVPLENVLLAGRPLGPLGLSAAAGGAAWLEWALLRRSLARRLGPVGVPGGVLARMFGAAILAAGAARAVSLALPTLHPLPAAAIILGVFGALYFLLVHAFRLDEASNLLRRLRGRT